MEILNGNVELAEITEGMTTDRVFFVKSLSNSHTNDEIIRKLEKQNETIEG